ncbi:MAG: hypothetical protein VW964_04860, partial [Ilumatobacter sp.]
MSLAARADRLLEVVDDRAGVDPGLPLLEAPDREAVLHLATDVRRRLASVADRSTMSEDRLR